MGSEMCIRDSWEEQERERYRVTLVPVENQLSSGQPVEQEQRRLQPSESQRFEVDEELEYVELDERRQEAQPQRRYLDEAEEERYAEEWTPRRPVPASRRPVQQPGEPLDVEPMENPGRPPADSDLDDPW